MDEQEEFYEPVHEPVWKEAVRKWFDEISNGLESSGADCSMELAREFAATVNWSPCDYCAGPCGYCEWKEPDGPCECDPCPQDQFGINECTCCPVATLKYLHDLLPTKSK